jgi:hypothetical protein
MIAASRVQVPDVGQPVGAAPGRNPLAPGPRKTWRMPPLDQLPRPVMSPVRKTGLLLLRGYLIVAVLLVTIKIFSSFIH